MNFLASLARQSRLLMLGAALTALTLFSLAQVRQADAQFFSLPDLKVTSHEVKYLGYPFFEPGYYLVFTVKNTGNADAAPSTVQVRSKSNVVLQSFAMSAKHPGEGAMFFHKLPYPGNCGFSVAERTLVVDAASVVFEGNEANNTIKLAEGYGPGPC